MQKKEILYEQQTPCPVQIVIVTGHSGAGKSTVLRALEDVGFFCVDNLPVALLDSFFGLALQAKFDGRRLALGIDIRGGLNIAELTAELKRLNALYKSASKIFFLTSSSSVLLKRFQETRRRHPLGNSLDIAQAIEQEKVMLAPLLAQADLRLDTDQLTIHQLRQFVRNSFSYEGSQHLLVTLTSFGFKYGVPPESNFLFDIRSLPNPYFIPDLKYCNGIDKQVQDYLFAQSAVVDYWTKLIDFITYCLQKSYEEGRFFINVAIGCTGGKHRSVAFVHKLAQLNLDKVKFLVDHRDINRDRYQEQEPKEEVVTL